MPAIHSGRPTTYRSLTVFPLFAAETDGLPYLLLADALAAGLVRITEVGSGTVPELLARNDADRDVLVLDGEQLVGARQNRTTSRSILLGAKSEVRIPVSCMEQGRWHPVSPEFSPGAYNSPSRVRRHARRAESDRAERGEDAAPEVLSMAQSLVWDEIGKASGSLGARSSTHALNEMYDQRAADLDAWAAAFPAMDGQVGVFGLLAGRPLALDLVGDPALYRRMHPRVMMGYAMDAISEPGAGSAAPSPAAAEDYLAAVHAARRSSAPTPGKGSYRVLSGAVIGAELEDGGRLVHLSAFPGARPERGPGAPLRPPSRRRPPE